MKKAVLAFAAALSLAASAAKWERAGALQVADQTGLTAAVAKLGEIGGNQMLGAMAAAQIAQMPTSEFFGPTRLGGSIVFPFYVDMAAFAKAGAGDMAAFDSLGEKAFEYAVVYPMAITREEFVKLHKGAVETNGMLRVKGLPFGGGKGDYTYVAFEKDGKWAIASDKPAQVAIAVKDLSKLVKPMKGDVVRLSVTPKGFAALRKVVDVAVKKSEADGDAVDKSLVELLKGFNSAKCALRVGDAGLDLYGSYTAVKGSSLASMGEKTFSADALSASCGDALFLSMTTLRKSNLEAQWKIAADILLKHNIDTAKFMKWQFGQTSRLVFDTPALVKFSEESEKNGVGKVDCDALVKDLQRALADKNSYEPVDAPEGLALEFAGYKPKFSAADRFSATLPETKDKPLVGASVFSLAGFIQAILPAALDSMDEKSRAQAATTVALLPKEARRGIASAYWRESDTSVAFITRISADELKGIGTSVGAILAASMMNGAAPMAVGDDDEEDSSDED